MAWEEDLSTPSSMTGDGVGGGAEGRAEEVDAAAEEDEEVEAAAAAVAAAVAASATVSEEIEEEREEYETNSAFDCIDALSELVSVDGDVWGNSQDRLVPFLARKLDRRPRYVQGGNCDRRRRF